MTDYFRVLDLPKQPWIDPAALQARFLELSTQWHPDRHHTDPEDQKAQAAQHYTLINTAFLCLKEPHTRLAHLLELESHRKPAEIQEIPQEIASLFMEVAELCREVDPFLKERNALSSPVLKAQTFLKGQKWFGQIQQLQRKLAAWSAPWEATLKEWNQAWESAPPEGSLAREQYLPLQSLELHFRLLRYEARWSAQLRERLFQLSG